MAKTYRRSDPVEPEESAPGEGTPGPRRPAWAAIARVVLIVLAILLVLVLGFLILIQTEWGRARVEGIVLSELRSLLTEEAELEVRRIEGGFVFGARMLDAVIREGNEVVIEMDTLEVRYNLLTLFRRTFSASRVYLGGARVWARQGPDGTWNLGRILEPTEPDPDAEPWIILLDDVGLRRGLAEFHFFHPERDSVLAATPIQFDLRGFRLDDNGVRVRVDTLLATVSPAVLDPVPVDVRFAGDIEPDGASVDGLLLRSDRSDVRVSGLIGWREDFTFDADLTAEPLALADLRQFVFVPIFGTADVRIQASGTADDILARVAADFEDHGALDLAGVISTGRVGQARYAVEGTLTNFDPGRFMGDPEFAGVLNADVAIDLAGPTLDTIDGTVDVAVRGSEFQGQRIVRADLDGRFDRGRLNFTLGAAVPGAHVLARGGIRPFDDVIVYDVHGDVTDLNLAALMRDPDQDVAVRRATFHLDGRGIDPETLSAAYTIAATDARVGDLVLASAQAQGSLRGGLLRYDADLRLPRDGGRITGVGTARPFAEPLVYEVESGAVAGLNLAVVTGDPDHDSDLTGAFTLTGTGTDPETMRLDFAAALSGSRFGEFAIVSANASGTLVSQSLTLDLAADLGEAGRLSAVGTAEPFADPVTYAFSGRVDNLDLAVLLDDPAQSSNLTGTYTLTGAGTDPETLAADFVIELEPSRFREQELLAGTMQGQLRAGTLVASIDAITPEGLVAFDVTMRPFDPEPALALTEGRFAGLNLALLLGEPMLQTDLHGRVEVDLTTLDPATAVGNVRIDIEPSTINAALLDAGRIDLQLERGTVTGLAVLDFREGEAGLAFHGRPLDAVPTYNLDGRLDSLDVIALMSDTRMSSRVNVVFDLTGAGFDPETLDARLELAMQDSRLPDAHIDGLVADVALTGGVLFAHDFNLAADFADARAEGQIALFDTLATTDLRFAAAVHDAGPLDALTEEPLYLESADVDGRFVGPAGGPIAFDGSAIARQFTYGAYGVRRVDARLNVEFDLDDEIPVQGRARLQFDFVSLPTFNLRDGDVTITRDDGEFAAQGRVAVDDDRDLTFRASFDAIDDPAGPYHTAVVIDELNMRLGEDDWELLQPATVSLGEGRYLIRNFLLFADGQQIAADGEIDLQGEQTLLFTAEDVQIDAFTDLIGYRGVGGILTANVSLEGLAAAPTIEALLEIEELTSRGELVGSLDADLSYADEQLQVEALLTHVDGETLEASGFVPIALRLDGAPAEPSPDAAVNLAFRAEEFPIDWARPFIPPRLVTELDGSLTTDATVVGTYANPLLAGRLVVVDGRLGLETTGDAIFRDIALVVDLDGNEARIVEARVSDGAGGLLTIEGAIMVPELAVGELDLRLIMSNFRVIDTETYHRLTLTATRGQNLRFRGTIAEPVLSGNATIVAGDIFLTHELAGPDLEPVILTEAQIQRIEATFGVRVAEIDPGPATFVDNLDLDVALSIERNVWLRSRHNPRFDVEFAGTVSIAKPPQADYQLFGTIEVTRGRLELPTLAARSFAIGTVEGTYARLVFNGPIEETLINVRAGLEAPAGLGRGVSATIYASIDGRLAEDPDFTLSSDPAMEMSDIACVIATGRPCGEAFQGDIAEDIAIGHLGLLVENIAARQLGLDVVEVVQRPTGELVVTFGTYVGSRTFAAVSQPVTEARSTVEQTASMAPEILIEHEILRWLLLRLERRNIGGTGGGLYIQFDY